MLPNFWRLLNSPRNNHHSSDNVRAHSLKVYCSRYRYGEIRKAIGVGLQVYGQNCHFWPCGKSYVSLVGDGARCKALCTRTCLDARMRGYVLCANYRWQWSYCSAKGYVECTNCVWIYFPPDSWCLPIAVTSSASQNSVTGAWQVLAVIFCV